MTAVEVIVPVFNDQFRLNCLLKSLAEQTLDPDLFSVTVVDNGSESPVSIPAVCHFPVGCYFVMSLARMPQEMLRGQLFNALDSFYGCRLFA